MSLLQISHSPDLTRLQKEGYEIEIRSDFLIVHHIPYVNSSRQVRYGKFITVLTHAGNHRVGRPDNHVIDFMGEFPCHADGSRLTALEHGTKNQTLFEGIIANFSFSNKPRGLNNFDDYYQKITHYVNHLLPAAQVIDPVATPYSFRAVETKADESVFVYSDSNSARASIFHLADKFKNLNIGIVGLGGTGSYILDSVSKTPVSQIRLFDGDVLYSHNAFRYPGAASLMQVNAGQKKVEYLSEIYSRMHRGIMPHPAFITEQNLNLLTGLSYIFLCVDNNKVRKLILTYALKHGIPVIDVGMGLQLMEDQLVGTMRTVTVSATKNDHLLSRISLAEEENNVYATNIQIAELNMLNAAMAIIKWKKLCGFYQDLLDEHTTFYSLNDNLFLSQDCV
ncbi:ThiF family adenylyltransferase [Cytophagaceae bacterium DM2B3-1]|uniref:ThiF family adenylyltransferase n=1 Tax=Xanthocytophaga flava TaxID=3048013 RepID=A0ABT7CV64_9BACT|nr:ThiF family adenylyltransferase [Xanthocytophaga flavus]MDJ1497654.1 ThiF family adenylyltransferase [Xanthocytophaga flavus]